MEGESASTRIPDVLLRSAHVVTSQPDEAVFEQGFPGDAAYLLVSGMVKISQQSEAGHSNVLAILGPGDVFGELSLFDGGVRSASAHAVSAVTMRELDRAVLDDLLRSRPDVALWLTRQLARRLRRATDAAADLVFADVPSRTARVLLDLAEQFGHEEAGVVVLDHGLTQLELAQMAGAARESVNKALGSFAARGWVSVADRSARLLDVDALTRRAGRGGRRSGPGSGA